MKRCEMCDNYIDKGDNCFLCRMGRWFGFAAFAAIIIGLSIPLVSYV